MSKIKVGIDCIKKPAIPARRKPANFNDNIFWQVVEASFAFLGASYAGQLIGYGLFWLLK